MVRLAHAIAIGLTALLLIAGAVAPAAAQDESTRIRSRLDRGQAQFDALDYREAISTLAPIPRDAAATNAQRLRALELIAMSHLILGEEALARQAFRDLLAIDPGYQLRDESGSPKIRNFFDAVKRELRPESAGAGTAELTHSAPTGATAGQRFEVRVDALSGANAVKEVVLAWRRRGVLDYRSESLAPGGDGHWRGGVQAPSSAVGYILEYYLEARDIGGRAIGRVGGPETPLAVRISPGLTDRGEGDSDTTPWYGRWYSIAGGVALVTIGSVLAISAAASGPEDGSLQPGRITLTP